MNTKMKNHKLANIEALESRRLLSAGPSAVTSAIDDAGTLVILGTKKADSIVVSRDGTELVVSSAAGQQRFDAAAVTGGISALLGKGSDSFTVDDSGGAVGAVTLSAGAGNDTVTGGEGDDSLNGDQGNDQVNGAAGDDSLRGGQGKDLLSGGEDDDDLYGDQGNDILGGGSGRDGLWGGNGKDLLGGEGDDDLLKGENGNDTLLGGSGDDDLSGGNGKDSLSGDDGDDDLSGDSGKDLITGGTGSDLFSDDDEIEEYADKSDDDGLDAHVAVADVPAAVLAAFNTDYPSAVIREVEAEQEDEGLIYEIDFVDPNGFRGEAEYLADGTPIDA